MSTGIIRFEKKLVSPTVFSIDDSFCIRRFTFTPDDVRNWLRIRNATSAELKKGRDWTPEDFSREFATLIAEDESDSHPTGCIWFAAPLCDTTTRPAKPVGTISIRIKRSANASNNSTINWLSIRSSFRRRGLATSLLQTVEIFCWETGVRQIELSTLETWHPAIEFYKSRGFSRK